VSENRCMGVLEMKYTERLSIVISIVFKYSYMQSCATTLQSGAMIMQNGASDSHQILKTDYTY